MLRSLGMIPVKRVLLVDNVVAHLRREIDAGTLTQELPSCRQLAKLLKVSVPTVLAAFEQLVAEGRVVRGKARQPYRLAALPVPEAGGEERRCILLISSKPVAEFDVNTRAGVDRLIKEVLQRGWEFQQRLVPYANVRHAGARWDEIAAEVRPSQLVALSGNRVLAEWAAKRSLPTLFIGGVPGENPGVTAVGVSLPERMRQAMKLLLDLGHRHISAPICGVQETIGQWLREDIETALTERGISYVPNYHAPISPTRTPAAIPSLLPAVLAARPPTALIFVEWIDFVAAIGVLAERGLFFGKDVVAVLLSHDPHLEWFSPQPAYFRLPTRKLERLIIDWLRKPTGPRFRKGGLILLPHRFYEGGAFHGPGAG